MRAQLSEVGPVKLRDRGTVRCTFETIEDGEYINRNFPAFHPPLISAGLRLEREYEGVMSSRTKLVTCQALPMI